METKQIKLSIDGVEVSVADGISILDAAKKINVHIPTLCHHEDLCVAGNCRICVVEVEGQRSLSASCATPAHEGMVIKTNTAKVRKARRDVAALLVSEHNTQCTTCYRSMNCELQAIASEYNVDNNIYLSVLKPNIQIDKSSWSIEKDDSKCIRCQRCVRTCAELQHVNALTVAHKGEHMKISTFLDLPMNEVVCTNCGQCINRCPTGALTERRYFDDLWEAIDDPTKHVVMNTAPSVRVALGEMLGYPVGTRVTGKMVAAMKKIGMDSVLDTDFTADLTIIEEGTELLGRLKKALVDKDPTVKLPMMTSCSPGWIKFIEHMYPEHLGHLSTCKSPQQMFGALAKTYYAEKKGIDPKDIVSVAIMPCAAKKYEANRPEMKSSGYQDVDAGLTTRELGFMIKQAGIDFRHLEDAQYDSFMGESTGAAVIFGATGGVMEAALRTAYEIVTGREVPFKNLNITPVRGTEGIKAASIKVENCVEEWKFLEGAELNVAVAHGLKNARIIMDQIAAGESPYHFIEVMACPGGCIGGGGQPIPTNEEIRKKRIAAIYEEDAGMSKRKSHENEEVIAMYKEYLGEPNGHKSHELLHTHYRKRNRY
ncbi:MAG: [FeFe] hydrogenase, group A [Bacteroidales bacterium]|nr:[FeFe] hydrogenase, group A [Bacteroidales bacterium]MCF8458779.1 [FeFe] hydrogenase, group A [Bacteroidales bacterium]